MARIDSRCPKAWFPIPNDPDNGEVLIQLPSAGEEKDILEEMAPFETVFTENTQGARVREMRERKIGDKRYLRLILVVKDWRNIKMVDPEADAEDENPPLVDAPCDEENIVRFARSDEDFDPFVGECLKTLREQRDAAKKAAIKN